MNDQAIRIKKIAIVSVCIGIVLFVMFLYFYCSSLRDNGGATDGARIELEHARTEQREVSEHAAAIERGLDASAGTVEAIRTSNQSATESVSRAQERNEDAQRIISESRRIVSESKSILATVRNKGK